MERKYFIAVYTNEVKDYCDEIFFRNLHSLLGNQPVHVIDNSKGDNYFKKLQVFFSENQFNNFHLYHLDVPEYPIGSQFQRNVCESVNHLRDIYLQSNLPYFLIIESDVYPPLDLLEKFENSICKLNTQSSNWGIIGGLYYEGFHNYNFDTTATTIEETLHCLSGCTLYKRDLIEKFAFRYEPSNLGPFPDAFISYDAAKEFSLWNEHLIKCDHLHNTLNGLRVT